MTYDIEADFIDAERSFGTKLIMFLIAGYYIAVGGLLGIVGMFLMLGSLFGIVTEMWGITLSSTIMGLLMVCGGTAVLRFDPRAWIIALLVALLTILMPGPTDWGWFAVNMVIMLYLGYVATHQKTQQGLKR